MTNPNTPPSLFAISSETQIGRPKKRCSATKHVYQQINFIAVKRFQYSLNHHFGMWTAIVQLLLSTILF